MAFYSVTISSPLSQTEAWSRLSDVCRFVEWDPGVVAARKVEDSGSGVDASYILTVKGFRPNTTMDLQYDVVHFASPERFIMVADTGTIRSEDEIVVSATSTGCDVTYNAELTLQGRSAIFQPLMSLVFKRIGDRAAKGLAELLEARNH